MKHAIALLHRAGRDGGRAGNAGVDRREVLLGGGEQLLEAVADEAGFRVAADAARHRTSGLKRLSGRRPRG